MENPVTARATTTAALRGAVNLVTSVANTRDGQ
jgi:hypothetical protein